MDRQPRPYTPELPPFGSIDHGIASDSRQEVSHGLGDGSAYIQRLRNKGTPYSHWLHRVGITFTSLAAVYFLLRCFELVRESPGVVGAPRSLAAGSRGTCQEDTSPSGEEEQEFWVGGRGGAGQQAEIGIAASDDGGFEQGYMPQQAWWAGGLVVAGDHGAAGVGVSEEEGLESWYTPQWPSGPAATSSGAHEGFYPFSLPSEQGTAARGVAAVEQGVRNGGLPTRFRGPVQYPSRQRVIWNAGGKRLEQYFSRGNEEGRGDDEFRLEWGLQLTAQGDLSLWEERSLPPYALEQVKSIYGSMIETARGCQTLVQALPGSQGLRLAHSVMRLLALNLGAVSVIPRDLEYSRSLLGEHLLELGSFALRETAEDSHLRSQCVDIQSLISLIRKLKETRRTPSNHSPLTRMKKMVSLVRMAGMTVKICSSVLSGLSARRSINGVPEEVLQQQLRVLDAVFREHSKYIQADNLHKSFILYCQRHTQQQALLPPEPETSAPTLLPSLKKMLQGISTAVLNAGGLLQFAGGEKPHDLLLPNPQEPSKPDDPNTQIQADEGAPQESHSSSEYTGLTPSLEVHTAAPSIGPPPPQVAAWRLGTQPVESIKPTLPHHPQYAWNTNQEELENPPYLLASRMLGTSMSWMHTPAHGDKGTHPPVSRQTQQPGGAMTSFPPPSHGDDVGVPTLQRSLLEHSLYAVSRWPEQQSTGVSAEASVGVESRRGLFRGGNVPDQALPAPWAPASTDSGQHMPTRVVTWTYGAGEQSIPQRPRPEQADGMLAELIRGGLRLEDIFPEDSDVSSPM